MNIKTGEDMLKIFYRSTRGSSKEVSSAEAIISGIADDGGLFVPSFIPEFNLISTPEYIGFGYRDLAENILSKFLTDYSSDEIKYCVDKAYDEKFDSSDIAPLVKAGDAFFLELYHGATAAFKDMALSLLPHLLTKAALKMDLKKKIVILTATSGDTGKAALESFSNVEGVKIIVYYPSRGVSLIQERQMVTQQGENTFVCAVNGNFDDAQAGVKKIFNDAEFIKFLDSKNYVFSSANSINIGRLIPQIVYYVYAYFRLVEAGEIEAGQVINILIPTGNFGNILAAYYAKKMGLPVQRLICASNSNNILYDFINTGIYNKKRALKLTMSPSMDILISSNLERLIFDICNCDPAYLKKLYEDLRKDGLFEINDEMKERMADFWAGYATEEETLEAIKKSYYENNYLIDTHTAVGFHVYNDYREITNDKVKTIIASTASPFKFPFSVLKAIDKNFDKYKNSDEFVLLERLSEITGLEIPKPLQDIGSRPVIHKNFCEVSEMKDFIIQSLELK